MRSLVLLVALVGCGDVANPRSCLDGSCTDSRFPYCDIEGLIEGPQTCVAVECSPGEFEACRGDRAITCNPTGNNFDLVDCPNGCDENGCIPPPDEVACTTNAQCSNPAPICGGDMTCRGCTSNDECSSAVCEPDTGACTLESAVVYASPDGSATADCSLAAPCTLGRAVMHASLALGKTLRMLPGNYAANLDIAGNVVLKIEASGAALAGTATMSVTGGANVDVRGLKVTTPGEVTLTCGDVSVAIAKSTLRLTDVQAGLGLNRCTMTMRGGAVTGFVASDDASFDADGVRFAYGFARTLAKRLSIRVVNSVFEDCQIDLGGTSDPAGATGSTLSVAFSTFVFRSPSRYFTCSSNLGPYERTEKFENNIFVAMPDTNRDFVVYMPRTCIFANNIMFPQDLPIGGNPVVDPQLVDLAGKDYHLKPTSPAINTGLPSAGLSTTHDFDGVSRPQGTAHDIGAFERVP